MAYVVRREVGTTEWTEITAGATSPEEDTPGGGNYEYAVIMDRFVEEVAIAPNE